MDFHEQVLNSFKSQKPVIQRESLKQAMQGQANTTTQTAPAAPVASKTAKAAPKKAEVQEKKLQSADESLEEVMKSLQLENKQPAEKPKEKKQVKVAPETKEEPTSVIQTQSSNALVQEASKGFKSLNTRNALNQSLKEVFNTRTGKKSAEAIAETMRKVIEDAPSNVKLIAIQNYKKMALGGVEGREKAKDNLKKAITAVQNRKGMNFNKDRDLKIPLNQFTEAMVFMEGVGDLMLKINVNANFDHIAIILKDELSELFMDQMSVIRPPNPQFLYSKAYYASQDFELAFFDCNNRFQLSSDLLCFAKKYQWEETIKAVKRFAAGKEEEFQNIAITDYEKLEGAQRVGAMVHGAYIIDWKFLGQIKDVKLSKNTPRHSNYKLAMAIGYMKTIKLWDYMFDGNRSEQFGSAKALALTPIKAFVITYYSCLADLRSLIKSIKNEGLGKTTGSPSANADSLDSFDNHEYQLIMENSELEIDPNYYSTQEFNPDPKFRFNNEAMGGYRGVEYNSAAAKAGIKGRNNKYAIAANLNNENSKYAITAIEEIQETPQQQPNQQPKVFNYVPNLFKGQAMKKKLEELKNQHQKEEAAAQEEGDEENADDQQGDEQGEVPEGEGEDEIETIHL